ncbi:unnamed protein product [Gongylonema pulchrum]|uniref:Lysosomal trafficking regulator lyst n=1 Tax=Gongylonema pulchrum TaxID=637853 RepID=A0A183DUP3_9BILA|nr:unnamed protein product [Gongylonema pulchrum]
MFSKQLDVLNSVLQMVLKHSDATALLTVPTGSSGNKLKSPLFFYYHKFLEEKPESVTSVVID